MKFPKWTGFQEKTLWDWLELLLVPSMLAIGIALIEITEGRRQEENLNEQYKQQVLRDYLNEMNTLVFEKEKMNVLRKAELYTPEREVLASRTLATLEILANDTDRKSQIVRFIGNSSLSRLISIRRANLANSNLSYVDLSGADLRETDLSDSDLEGANLKEANLCGVNLNNANLQDVNLTDAIYSETTLLLETTISQAQLESMKKRDSNSCDPTLEDINQAS
ncbi:MAG: pentapeptide repeat-containing protein [Crocosphaera sp.]